MNLKNVEVERIKNFDFFNKELFASEYKNLEKSIIENKVVSPLKCVKKGDFYFLIDGFKRLKIIKSLNFKTIPVIVENYNSEINIFVKHFKYNLYRNFSPIELANFLTISLNYFKSILLCNYIFLKLSGKTSKKIIENYSNLNKLIEDGKEMLINEKLNLNIAFKIATLDNKSQTMIIKLIKNFKLNTNKQKKVFEYFYNLSKRFNKKISEIINNYFAVYCEEMYSKNLENDFFDKLEKLHSPDFYNFHKKFLEKKNLIIKDIKGVNIYSPVNYEDDIFKAELYFRNFNELKEKIEKLLSRLSIEN